MNLGDWQKTFAVEAAKKFPNNARWSQQDRLLSILRQLSDVSGTIQNEQQLLAQGNHEHTDANHRIAALLADIFILCHERGMDLDVELEKVLSWYRDGTL